MRRVHKHPLPNELDFEIFLAKDCEIIHVEKQHDKMCMWVIEDIDKEKILRKFKLVGTGQNMVDVGEYIATWLSGPYVVHMFEAY